MGDKISVACKLPAGFTIDHKGERLTLNGPQDAGNVAGFGVTRGVDAAWFKNWCDEVTAKFKPLASGAIFPIDSDKPADVEDAVRERAPDVRTGLEPLDPEAPMEGIEPTDEQRKANAEAAETAPAAPKAGSKPGEAKKPAGK